MEKEPDYKFIDKYLAEKEKRDRKDKTREEALKDYDLGALMRLRED